MKYFIKINRSTLRKNPHAGNQCFYRYIGRAEITEIDGELITKITHSWPMEKIYSLTPEPSWLYQYEDTKVCCNLCKVEFFHKELEQFSDEDSDGNYYHNETVCPRCGAFDCCELEFETLKK